MCKVHMKTHGSWMCIYASMKGTSKSLISSFKTNESGNTSLSKSTVSHQHHLIFYVNISNDTVTCKYRFNSLFKETKQLSKLEAHVTGNITGNVLFQQVPVYLLCISSACPTPWSSWIKQHTRLEVYCTQHHVQRDGPSVLGDMVETIRDYVLSGVPNNS